MIRYYFWDQTTKSTWLVWRVCLLSLPGSSHCHIVEEAHILKFSAETLEELILYMWSWGPFRKDSPVPSWALRLLGSWLKSGLTNTHSDVSHQLSHS